MGSNTSGIRCAGSNGLNGLKSSIGYLTFTADGKLVFVAKRWFRHRFFEVSSDEIREMRWSGNLMVDTFAIQTADGKQRQFEVFRPTTLSGDANRQTAAA